MFDHASALAFILDVPSAHNYPILPQVKHFFKVGEVRSQAGAMLRSIVFQMAERMPGFAALLQPVVEEHGDGSTLSSVEMFDAFMLKPFLELDQEREAADSGGSTPSPAVVMLLDALDEAADGNRDWEAVAGLLSSRCALWVWMCCVHYSVHICAPTACKFANSPLSSLPTTSTYRHDPPSLWL